MRPCPSPWQLWYRRDGIADGVFELGIASSSQVDVTSITITGPGTWDTVADNNAWAIGVTKVGGRRLLNNKDSSYATNLTSGLTVQLHCDDAGQATSLFASGTTFKVTVTFTGGLVSTATATS